ncbi:hypothetical protein ACLB0R_01735 [Sphingomonas sp. GlSt437]|uniref:hypothetical protein n=1 Tax=Sphingomonas sp. GlSt437 TaxID=3389970 RepID=UPI003A86E0E9
MAFREKIAWLTLLAMVVAYSIYFSLLAAATRNGAPPLLKMLGLFGAVTLTQLIIVTVVAAILAIGAHREAQAAADERDRAIARRSANIGYYVLMVGVIVAGVVMPFYAPAWQIINASLVALVMAEAVRHVIIIASYRRGWHG